MCTGASRHSAPCYDDLNSGKCTSFGMLTCQSYCAWSVGCALFVVYSVLDSGDNMDGSCVLCYDLHENEPTKDLRTRVYRYTEPQFGLPPAPPSQPSPSPPPHPPPPPPPPEPTFVTKTSYRDDGMAACTFYAPYELVYEAKAVDSTSTEGLPPSPPSSEITENAMARAKVDHTESATACCTSCADDESCEGFVFEHASHVCVSLPTTGSQQLVPRFNPGMTSGFVRRYSTSEKSPPPSPPPAQCKMLADRNFAGSKQAKIGVGRPPDGQLMASAEVCCGVCAAHPECTKFTFEAHSWTPGIGECMLFRGIAEAFKSSVAGLVAGTVVSRDIAAHFVDPPTPPQLEGAPRPSPPPYPPEYPVMATLVQYPVSGSGEGNREAPQGVMMGAAIAFVILGMLIIFLIRFFCCSADAKPKFKSVAPRARPGRAIKGPGATARLMNGASDDDDEEDDDDDDDDEPRSRRGKKGKQRGKKGGKQKLLTQRERV